MRAVATQQKQQEQNVLRVATKSDANDVARAIAWAIQEQGKAETQTIGAGALNQAVKALAIARGLLASLGIDLRCYPIFVDVEIDGEDRTAIKMIIEPLQE